MCCQENDKSSPSSHLSLPLAARIFSSIHYYPLSCSFSPPSHSVSCLYLLSCANISFFLTCPHFCSSSLLSFLFLSCLLPPPILLSPLPHSSSSNLHPALPPHLLTSPHSHHLPHYVHTIYLSVTLFFGVFFYSLHSFAFPASLLPCLLPSVL